jgi:transcription elongation GreA/GreB family factor
MIKNYKAEPIGDYLPDSANAYRELEKSKQVNDELAIENNDLKKEAVYFMKESNSLKVAIGKVIKLYEEGKSFKEAIEIVKSTLDKI